LTRSSFECPYVRHCFRRRVLADLSGRFAGRWHFASKYPEACNNRADGFALSWSTAGVQLRTSGIVGITPELPARSGGEVLVGVLAVRGDPVDGLGRRPGTVGEE